MHRNSLHVKGAPIEDNTHLIPASGSTPLKYIKNTEVTFNFTCRTQFGDRVALVGNIGLLGHWDTQKAIFLYTTPDTYPVWTIKIDLPRDKTIEYKYLIIKEIIMGGVVGPRPLASPKGNKIVSVS
jgi:hypothetical protein